MVLKKHSASFSSRWKGLTSGLASVAALLAFGAVLHGGATVYASDARVTKVEIRVFSLEATTVEVREQLKGLDDKLNLAIELLKERKTQ
jgi:hypothetical protein